MAIYIIQSQQGATSVTGSQLTKITNAREQLLPLIPGAHFIVKKQGDNITLSSLAHTYQVAANTQHYNCALIALGLEPLSKPQPQTDLPPPPPPEKNQKLPFLKELEDRFANRNLDQIDSLTKQLKAAQSHSAEVEKAAQQLSDQLANALTERDVARSETDTALKSASAQLRQEQENHAKEILRLQEELGVREERARRMSEALVDLGRDSPTVEMNQLKQKIATQTEELQSLQKQLAEAHAKGKDVLFHKQSEAERGLRQEVGQLQTSLEQSRESIRAQMRANQHLNEQLAARILDEQLAAKIPTLEAEIAQAQASLRAREEQFLAAQSHIEAQEASMQGIRNATTEEINALHQRFSDQQFDMIALQSQLATARAEQATAAQSRFQLEKDLQEAHAALASGREEDLRLRRRLNVLNESSIDMTRAEEERRQLVLTAQAQDEIIKGLQADLIQAKQSEAVVKDLGSQITTLRMEKAKLESLNEEAARNLAAMRAGNKAIQDIGKVVQVQSAVSAYTPRHD